MKGGPLLTLFLFFLVLTSSVGGARRRNRKKKQVKVGDETAPARLQVAVMHRPDDCQEKSLPGDFIQVHYTGQLEDGHIFDSSVSRGTPLTFQLGTGQVIPGWDQGLQGMCVGETRKLTVPPSMAYGAEGVPGVIPQQATLIFVVEMVAINPPDLEEPELERPDQVEQETKGQREPERETQADQ